ncbi:helix-turn-helix domain-containing protein [Streptomyces sp. NPDC090025]|uniref:helix-turn-helix domain-containing protein n=1 Tax=Streptomyces sp. NPDC090025 TaxID=3365922 RepID=UPI0038383E41
MGKFGEEGVEASQVRGPADQGAAAFGAGQVDRIPSRSAPEPRRTTCPAGRTSHDGSDGARPDSNVLPADSSVRRARSAPRRGRCSISQRPVFAEVLRGHRRAARLTLEQLAEASGVSARSLSDMERGQSKGPQQRTVAALTDALALDEETRKQFVELAREGRLRDHRKHPVALCELPGPVSDFTGRAREIDWVNELVRSTGSPGVGVTGLVTGSAGLGKTSFAVHAAHSIGASFPDGVLFVDLHGSAPQPLTAGDTLVLLLRALGVAERQIPGDLQGRASLYRARLREKRVLIVLDNASAEEQVRPLLPGGGPGRVLITTRRLLPGLEGVRRLVLGPLLPAESTELLARILGDRSTGEGRSALPRLAELCGGLPLALRIIGNRLLSRPGWDAAQLAARMADENHRLEQFKAGDLKIARAFGMSYEQLGESARRMFRRLAEVPGQDLDVALAAVAGGVSNADAWEALDELVDLGLLHDSSTGRYRFHDLVRLFARERLREEESEAEREALTGRVLTWLLATATRSGRWFEPGHDVAEPDRPGPSSQEEADWWLRANVDNWLGAMRAAAARGEYALVLDCAESMHWFSERWAHGPHWQEVFTRGAEAADALGDLEQQAAQLNYLAWVQWVPPSAPHGVLRYAAEARELATRADATAQIAWAHAYTAWALRLLRRTEESRAASARAADMFKSVGDADCYVQCLGNIADCLLDEGRHTEALERCREQLALLDDPGSGMTPSIAAHSRSVVLLRRGRCLGELGRRAEAIGALVDGIDAMDALQMSDFRQAGALELLASLLAAEGRTAESRAAYARAAGVFETVGDTEATLRCQALAGGG